MLTLVPLLLALALGGSVSARPAVVGKKDKIAEDDVEAFVAERRDPAFGCRWASNDVTGRRSFWCPSPCRLNDKVERAPGEDARPRHWVCPPTIKTDNVRKEALCAWRRNGRLACPSNCGWERDEDEAWIWTCTKPSLLRAQTPEQRQQFLLGWSHGPVDAVELEVRSAYLCGPASLACPLRAGIDAGATLTPAGSYECVDVKQDLHHCGGCSTLPDLGGHDCSRIKHAHAGCISGRCEILHCYNGYELNAAGTACENDAPADVHSSSL